MDKNDLLGLFGLDDKPKSAPPSKPIRPVVTPNEEAPGGNCSDSCLTLDEWDRERGKRLHAKFPADMREIVDPVAAADFLAAAYTSEPKLEDVTADARRRQYMETLIQSPEYQALRPTTVYNLAASELAAEKFALGWKELQARDSQRKPSGNPQKDATRKEAALMGAVAGALSTANEAVDEMTETMAAIGCGPGTPDAGKIDPAVVANLFKRTRDNELLRRIMELAGRYRRIAQSRQRQKVRHGYDDMVGVELGGDVGRLIPNELAALACPELELDAMRRLVERQMMCREYRGMESLGKGPIVVCVDESGSMYGDPLANAKAFALAMAWIARHQRRWCCLIGYSGGREGTRCVLRPGKWDQNALLEWLSHNYAGGTTMDVPMEELPRVYWPELVAQGMPRGKTDLIFVTDGVVMIPHTTAKMFADWKVQEKVRLISLIIDCPPGPLGPLSDEVHQIKSVSTGDNSIVRCLSI